MLCRSWLSSSIFIGILFHFECSGQSGGTLAGRIAFESKDVKQQQQALKLQEKRKSYNCYNRNADTLKGLRQRHQRKKNDLTPQLPSVGKVARKDPLFGRLREIV